MQPRLCVKCGYKGYFKLKEIRTPTPSIPFMEICPQCSDQIEIKEGERIESRDILAREVEDLAKKLGTTSQELVDEVFRNLIMEFNPKTGEVRLVSKTNGRTLFEHKP